MELAICLHAKALNNNYLHMPLCYRVLGQVLPSASAAYSALSENRQRWEELKKEGRKSP